MTDAIGDRMHEAPPTDLPGLDDSSTRPPSLTIQGLLATLRARLGELDEQIRGKVDAINAKTEQAQAMQDEIVQLQDLMTRMGDDESMEFTSFNTEERRLLTEHGITGPSAVEKSELQSAISSANTRLNRMNSGNEMLMIELQSAISQRGNEVGFATNAIGSVDDTLGQIIQNIGR